METGKGSETKRKGLEKIKVIEDSGCELQEINSLK